MIGPWLTYALLVSALVGLAAWLAEQGLRAQGWPTRWVWALALPASLVLPVLAWLRPPPAAPDPTIVTMPTVAVLDLVPVSTTSPAAGAPAPEVVLAAVWAVVSSLLLATVAVLAVRMARRVRRWRAAEVDGVPVLVSRDTGPAALGLLRGRIVVPEWALGLPTAQRRLLLLHEAEHVRARDPQLAFLALLLCVVAPWNLPLWWQLRRLRLALEVDCDARVLARAGDRAGYGSLLLAMGQRRAHLALALAEPRTMLERRIRMMTRKRSGRAWVPAVMLAGLAAGTLALACETPSPTQPDAPAPTEVPAEAPVQTVADILAKPTFTPMTRAPVLTNGDAVQEELQRRYPPLLKDAGIGGTASVWILVDETGEIRTVRLNTGSGETALDQAALAVAGTMAFEPALLHEEPVPVWVAMDITFETGAAAHEATERAAAAGAAGDDTAAGGDAALTMGESACREFVVDGRAVTLEAARAIPPERIARVDVRKVSDGPDGACDRVRITTRSAAARTDATPDAEAGTLIARDVTLENTECAEFMIDGHAATAAEVQALKPDRIERMEITRTPDAGPDDPCARVDGIMKEAGSTDRQRPTADAAPAGTRLTSQADEPTFTPMTAAPKLENGDRIRQLLGDYYPPLLRDAGIGGTASVWFYIDETGTVEKTRINRSSGHDALDRAALRVAEQMRFSPARNGDERVPVWIALDVKFEVP